jgi:hypothetical protein
MSCLGVHFALSEKEVLQLRSLPDDAARLELLQEEIEESYFKNHPESVAESDKAWDAMHRTLADGLLTWNGGKYPLNHAVLAGELLYTERDYIMSLKTPEQVRDIASALQELTQDEFKRRYFAINPKNYDSPLSEEDLGYTWQWFQNVKELYSRAAKENRYVLFTADQ